MAAHVNSRPLPLPVSLYNPPLRSSSVIHPFIPPLSSLSSPSSCPTTSVNCSTKKYPSWRAFGRCSPFARSVPDRPRTRLDTSLYNSTHDSLVQLVLTLRLLWSQNEVLYRSNTLRTCRRRSYGRYWRTMQRMALSRTPMARKSRCLLVAGVETDYDDLAALIRCK